MARLCGCDAWKFDFGRSKSQLLSKAIEGIFADISVDMKGWMILTGGLGSLMPSITVFST